jgi:Domain of unknown function (DUF4440)
MITVQKDTVDPQLRQQLDARGKKFDEAYNDNDATAVADLFTEDGVFVTDKGPIYGRKAIEKYYADRFQEWHFSKAPFRGGMHQPVEEQYRPDHLGKCDQSSPHAIGTAGNEVWEIGEWSQTIQGQNGDPIQLKGYWSTIDVREGDAWKTRMMTYNITPAEAK